MDTTTTPAARQRAQLVHRVTELHDASTARWLADHHPYALELVADGWTINGALDHLEGLCDVTVCTHPEHQPCACCRVRGAGHGHFAMYCQPCVEACGPGGCAL